MNTRDENYDKLQAIGRGAAEGIADMVAALECDYDRLEELRMSKDQPEWDDADAEELAELDAAAGECESREDAETRIIEDPLSVEVRSDWHAPGSEDNTPAEFCILLGTGGPAVRIRGELDEHCQPHRAWIEAQDWGTPWTQYFGDGCSTDTLLTYCQQFYFGG